MRIRGGIGIAPAACLAAIAACASESREESVFGDAGAPDQGVDAGSIGVLSGNSPCKNLQCQQVDCASLDLPTTTVTGVVFDPAGRNPLYNVIVYVPNAPVDAFKPGAVCDQCGVVASGEPLVTALTGSDGRFTLTNVPAGGDIPLVLQLGKWRKQIFVPHVAQCEQTTMDDPKVMRLPARKSEGDMPQLAIATGGCDAFECLLRKIGVDDSEFTGVSGSGRVHVYQGTGGTPLAIPTKKATDLWASGSLLSYDMIINACECSEASDEKPQTSIDNLVAYANGGGRIFNTHYQYYWIDPTKITSAPVVAANPSWQTTATFVPEVDGTDAIYGLIDESFPKGLAFAQWLLNVHGSPVPGSLPIDQARYNVTAATPPSTAWVSNPNVGQTLAGGNALLHYTFNTPVGADAANQCGKVLFSDFHVVAADGLSVAFPNECQPGPMTPQELALEFMLFDLSACVQKDTDPPTPPPPASQ
jgi:hypothetical protein